MKQQTTIDRAGRIVIPKALRDALRLEPGDTLEVDASGEEITLRPARSPAPLAKEQGIWVYQGRLGEVAIRELIDRAREERIESLLE